MVGRASTVPARAATGIRRSAVGASILVSLNLSPLLKGGVGDAASLCWNGPHARGCEGHMKYRKTVASLLFLTISAQAFAQEVSIDFSWEGVTTCRTISANPQMVIRNFPKEAKRVMLILTEGKNARGGQEVELPASGVIPAGEAWTMGVCNPDTYRWTAIFKSANGVVLGEAHVDRPFP
jgi:hypothetical protein